MNRVGVIDVGSNTIKLLVASASETGGIITDHIALEECRISKGISKENPVLSEESIRNAVDAVSNLVEISKQWKVSDLQISATSAVRDAMNGQDFANMVEATCGCSVDVLSGQEEAESIAFGLQFDPQIHAHNCYFHFDLGGGSLEFNSIVKGELQRAISMPLGAVRMTEAFVPDPFGAIPRSVRNAMEDHVSAVFDESQITAASGNTDLILTGGSATISRALVHERSITDLDSDRPEISIHELEELYERLSVMNHEERLKVPYLPANRADVVCAAIIVIISLMRRTEKEKFQHSLFSLRHGLAAKMLNL